MRLNFRFVQPIQFFRSRYLKCLPSLSVQHYPSPSNIQNFFKSLFFPPFVLCLRSRARSAGSSLFSTLFWASRRSAVLSDCQALLLLSEEHRSLFRSHRADGWIADKWWTEVIAGWSQEPLEGRLGSVYGYVCLSACLLRLSDRTTPSLLYDPIGPS